MFCFPIKFCSCVDSVVCFVYLLNCVCVCFPIKFCSCVDSVVCFVFLLTFVAVLTV